MFCLLRLVGNENDISTGLLGVRKMRLSLWKAHKNGILINSFKSLDLDADGSETLNIHLDFSVM